MTHLTRWSTVASAIFLLWSASVSPVRGQGTESKDFIVGTEDILEVQVWDNKDLNQVVFVRPDGKTSLPLAGEIQAAGKTVQELQDYLSAVYSKTVKGAAVTVIIREIRSRPIYFVGGFGKPGAMQLTRDLTLLQAVALVGGVAQGADAEHGFVLRKDKQIPIDFTKLTQKGELIRYDVVIANPPFSLKNWGLETAAKDPFGRFKFGVPPKSYGDFAFVQHMIAVRPDKWWITKSMLLGWVTRRQYLQYHDPHRWVVGSKPGERARRA